jgi:K+ transporter
VQLGICRASGIRHTSAREIGQITSLRSTDVCLRRDRAVPAFRIDQLAAAYGVEVTATMASRRCPSPRRARAALDIGKVSFSSCRYHHRSRVLRCNIVKVADFGWFPLAVACSFHADVHVAPGRTILSGICLAEQGHHHDSLRELPAIAFRAPGTAIFMTRNADGVPTTCTTSSTTGRTKVVL